MSGSSVDAIDQIDQIESEFVQNSNERKKTLNNWDTMPAHALPAHLQISLDAEHLQKIDNFGSNVQRLNYELKHVLNYVATEFKKHKASENSGKNFTINDGQLTNKMRQALDELETLYIKFYDEFKDKANIPGHIPDLPKEFKALFQNKESITTEEIEYALLKIDDMQRENKDKVTDIAQKIQLLGHLYTTITEITRKMQEQYLRFIERTAEKMGSR